MGRCKILWTIDENSKFSELEKYNDTVPENIALSDIELMTRWRALKPECNTFCTIHGLQNNGYCSQCPNDKKEFDYENPMETDVNCCTNCIYYGTFSKLVIPDNLHELGFYNYENFLNSRVLIRRCLNCTSFEDEKIDSN